MTTEFLSESPLIENLGWTLVHSVWQIAAVAMVLLIVLRVLVKAIPNVRYIVSVIALAVACALPVVTFIQITGARTVAGHQSVLPADIDPGPQETRTGRAGSFNKANRPRLDSANVQTGGIFAPVAGLKEFLDARIPDVFPFAVAAWLFGVAVYSLRLLGGMRQLHVYRTRRIAAPEDSLQKSFDLVCEKLHVRRHVRLFLSHLVETPIAVGWLKPMIIIPAGMVLQVDPKGLETVLAHELIHIRRYDPLVNIIQTVVEVVFFYHPGIHWISTQIRREREFAADARVVEIFTDSPLIYAKTLATLEEIRLKANKQTPRYATAVNGGNLMQRIQKILNVKTEESSANSAWTAGVAVLLTSAFLLGLFSFNSSSFVNAQKRAGGKKLAIGFVSIPPLDRTENAPKDSDATARLLIHKLKTHRVPATGFLQGGMVSDGQKLFPVRANIARMWRDAGFETGLGGFRHSKLYNTPVDEFIANIGLNERVAKQLLGDMALPPRYFSYPFLNTGRTPEDKAKVEAWLSSRGYTSVKYTFDNNEWLYSFAYDVARNDNDVNSMKEIREQYLAYMGRMFDHYEAYSAEMFGRDIPQTMVLTPSRLVTDTADEFFDMAAKRGYSFISVDEAQSDEAYKTPESFAGESGISWFERWSFSKGTRLRSEPEVDESVQKIWAAKQTKK